MSIYPIPYANEYDQSNVWPLTGKQMTFGIVELGFSPVTPITYKIWILKILEQKLLKPYKAG